MASAFYAQEDMVLRDPEGTDFESPGAYDSYIIQSGDTLLIIAQRFNTTVEALRASNSISDDSQILAGQALLVPKAEDALIDVYEVLPSDTLYSISRQFHTSVGILQGLNELGGSSVIVVGQHIRVPAIDESSYEIYTVADSDSLYSIARQYNSSAALLKTLNGIADERELEAGQTILVPKIDETVLERYIVQPGDSLYSIARRYGVSLHVLQVLNRLADIRDLRVDQVILAPTLANTTLAIHIAQPGDTLEGIAKKYETRVELLQSLNGIADPSLIEADKAIIVPTAKEILARPGFGFGIQVFIDRSRAVELAQEAKALGADWVKIDVSWAEIETAPDIYSYSALDSMIASMELAGLRIMLTVYDAPAWSRSPYIETLNSQFREYGGPPADYGDFANFLANLVIRYAGLVDAYEIWKSPNLVKFWTAPVYTRSQGQTDDGDYGIPDEIQMGARYYVPLLEVAFNTIKAHDDKAMVVAAGLAPVGFNDNYNSIDTVTFLKNMLAQGAAEASDAIGAVFSASAAPPTLACCDKPPGVDTHYESFLQYYGDLLAFYDETLKAHGLERPIIVTQLGWGTMDGANLAVPATGFEWLNYTSEAEQALYVKQAYRIAQKREYVSAIFLYNLNGCAVGDEEACFFSLRDAAGRKRPAFAAYQSVPKSNSDA